MAKPKRFMKKSAMDLWIVPWIALFDYHSKLKLNKIILKLSRDLGSKSISNKYLSESISDKYH